MNDLKIHYDRISPQKQRRVDRLTMLSAGVGLLLAVSENISGYEGKLRYILFLLIFLAVIDIVFSVYFDRIKEKFHGNFDILLLRINGFTYLVTGLDFHFGGSNKIQYCYYLLSIVFLFIIPHAIRTRKRSVAVFSESGISDRRRLFYPAKKIKWTDIAEIAVAGRTMTLSFRKKRRKRNYYLHDASDEEMKNIIEKLSYFAADHTIAFKNGAKTVEAPSAETESSQAPADEPDK